jgi:Protein of unknown function (DUF2937)
MGLLGRWLSHSVSTALALALGILAMQAPAFTREYAAALLQVATDARRDIDQREDSARQFYGISASQDDDLVGALKSREPSNAETLARSIGRAADLRAAEESIAARPALLQPLAAFYGVLHDPNGDRRPIWEMALGTYSLQLDLSFAAAIYGLAGVMLGSLVAELVIAPFPRMTARRRRRLGWPVV